MATQTLFSWENDIASDLHDWRISTKWSSTDKVWKLHLDILLHCVQMMFMKYQHRRTGVDSSVDTAVDNFKELGQQYINLVCSPLKSGIWIAHEEEETFGIGIEKSRAKFQAW